MTGKSQPHVVGSQPEYYRRNYRTTVDQVGLARRKMGRIPVAGTAVQISAAEVVPALFRNCRRIAFQEDLELRSLDKPYPVAFSKDPGRIVDQTAARIAAPGMAAGTVVPEIPVPGMEEVEEA